MNDDIEQRILAARASAQRQQDTAEFVQSLGPNDDIIKPVYSPEAFVMRSKARAAASRGEIPRTKCTHPQSLIRQFVDTDPTVKRKGRPVNLFECTQCGILLWLVDPWGEPIGDR